MVRAVQGLWARPLSGFGVRRRRAEGCRCQEVLWRHECVLPPWASSARNKRNPPPYRRISLFGFTATGRRASRTAGLSGPSLGWEGNILVSNPLNPV
jgi:hypothetical protein